MSSESGTLGDRGRRNRCTNRRNYLKVMGVATAGLLAGCSGSGNSSGGTTDGGSNGGSGGGSADGTTVGSSGNQLQHIVVGVPFYPMWSTSFRTVVAREMGYFEEEGLEVERLDVDGGGANVRAVVSGDTKAAMATGAFAAWGAYSQGSQVRIAGNSLNADDHYWFSAKGSGITELKSPQCNGWKLGFSSPGSSSDMITSSAIEQAGCKNAEGVAAGGPPENLTAVNTGEIDLGWDVWSLLQKPHADNTINVVFRGKDIKPWGNTTSRTIVTTKSWLNTDACKGFLRAIQRANKFTFNNMEESLDVTVKAMGPEYPEVYKRLIMEQANYRPEELDPTLFKGRDTINKLAKQNDFVNQELSSEQMNELIRTDVAPAYEDVDV